MDASVATVPQGTECPRLNRSPLHSDNDIDRLMDSQAAVWSDLEMKQAA